jgi:hypothetical protein
MVTIPMRAAVVGVAGMVGTWSAALGGTLQAFSPELTLGRLTEAALAQPADGTKSPLDQPAGRMRSWELPAVTVEGVAPSGLREEERVGTYGQPRWTTRRAVPDTRIYVIPEGKVEIEYWYRPTFTRDNTVETRMLTEVEFGLPYRFQLDLYFRTDQADAGSHMDFAGQFEVRWALADWGKIWGNPTLYFEYIVREDGKADKIEPKLLLGGEIAEGWHWGVNFVAELEIEGEDLEHEYEFTSVITRSIVDDVFTVGAAFKFSLIDVKDDRGHYSTPFFVGPTFQWRPVEAMTINLATLIGVGAESPRGQITVNVGWEF